MFANLASYLLGTQQPAEQEVREEQTEEHSERLKATEAEDDWVLVDSSNDSDDDRRFDDLAESAYECLPSLQLTISAIPYSHPTYRTHILDYYSLSCSASPNSLPRLTLEESWFLTPPPCFTSDGPIYMETSPLENLLIEHPSMSVYHQHRSPSATVRSRSDASGGTTPSSDDGPARVARRPTGTSAQRQEEKECVQMRSAQQIRVFRASQGLKRNPLDRTNKAREIASSKNKRQRRADHQQHKSGANNNRKCNNL